MNQEGARVQMCLPFVCKTYSRKGSWHQPGMLQAWVRSDFGPGDVLSSGPGFGTNTRTTLKKAAFCPRARLNISSYQ